MVEFEPAIVPEFIARIDDKSVRQDDEDEPHAAWATALSDAHLTTFAARS